MMAARPALRVALIGVGATCAATAIIAVFLGVRAHDYSADLDRASAVADGIVVKDHIGDEDDIRVRWRDSGGGIHQQRFSIYATGKYVEGSTFKVRYDDREPDAHAFPADPGETSEYDDLWVPILLAGMVAGAFVFAWMVRGFRFRRALRRPEVRVRVEAFAGRKESPAAAWFGDSLWLRVTDPIDPSAIRWQRVMWHALLDQITGELEAVAHGDLHTRAPLVIEASDGRRLVPVGRLRSTPPRHVELRELADTRSGVRDLFVVPEGGIVDTTPVWRRPAGLCAVGLMLGAVIGELLIGRSGAVVLAAGGGASIVNGWGFYGGDS